MKKTKEAMNEILKEAMSKKYCGSTRFDFLDDEEIPMIREAMYAYASQQTSELKAENERLREALLYIKTFALARSQSLIGIAADEILKLVEPEP